MGRRFVIAASLAALATAAANVAEPDTASPAVGPAQVTSARASALDRGTKTFIGSGRTVLGLIRLEREATLTWHHQGGGRLQITTGRKRVFLLLSTYQKQGSISLRRGTYNAVQVITGGDWRIQLRSTK